MTKTHSARQPYLAAMLRGNRGIGALAALAAVVNSATDIYIARIIQQLLDLIGAGSGMTGLAMMARETAVFTVVSFGSWLVLRYARAHFLARCMCQYKDYAFSRLTEKGIASFAHERTGRYISALTNDCASIEENLLAKLFELINNAIWIVGSLAMMFWYNWSLTLVVLALSVIPILASMRFGVRLTAAETRVSARNEGFVGAVKDLLSGFPVIKSFKAEREALRLFGRENAALEQTRRERRMTNDLIQIIGALTGFLVQFGVFFYGVYLCIRGSITVGVVFAFVQMMNYIIQPIRTMPQLLANARAALGLIDKLAGLASEHAGRQGAAIEPALRDAIEVRDVTCRYEGAAEPALRAVSQRFEAGRSYAVVGGSGSGKSTLLSLLMGAFGDYEGAVTVDGAELRQIAPESLYDLLSLIQQNVFIFDSSIRDNVTLFRDFPEEQVRAALEKAGLRELVEQRGGDCRCGENGANLSGGERQRISIARCLLRGTPVLLMDEATAALDAATARAVTDAILDIAGLTRILVTHKLEEQTLRRFDEIVVLRHGALCERGSFERLMAQKGYFYSLYTVAADA